MPPQRLHCGGAEMGSGLVTASSHVEHIQTRLCARQQAWVTISGRSRRWITSPSFIMSLPFVHDGEMVGLHVRRWQSVLAARGKREQARYVSREEC
jgi:hypothetical protein